MDFDKLPVFDRNNILRSIEFSGTNPLLRYEKLERFNVASERINAAYYHLTQMTDDMESEKVRYSIRAFLMETNAIKDALKTDLETNELKEQPIKLYETQNPLLILMDLLRQVNVHSIPNLTTGFGMSFIMNSGKEIKHHPFIFSDLSLDKIKLAENHKHYEEDDLNRIVDWMNRSPQILVGLKGIFYCGLCQYLEELIQKYNL